MFEFAPSVLFIILLFGGLTAFFAATIALTQDDIKKVIAYSTCSQLGYSAIFGFELTVCSKVFKNFSFFSIFLNRKLQFFTATNYLTKGACLIPGSRSKQESTPLGINGFTYNRVGNRATCGVYVGVTDMYK